MKPHIEIHCLSEEKARERKRVILEIIKNDFSGLFSGALVSHCKNTGMDTEECCQPFLRVFSDDSWHLERLAEILLPLNLDTQFVLLYKFCPKQK